MNRPLNWTLAALTLACLASLPAKADPISYTLSDYSSLENGYRLAGTITTDGTLGTWSSNHILGWNLTVYTPQATALYSLNSSAPGATVQSFLANGITATETSLGVVSGIGGFTLAANPAGNAYRIGYSPVTDQGRFFGNGAGGGILWNAVIPAGTTFEIGTAVAAVPEPASWALALAGLGVVGWCRRRAASRPDA